MRSRLLVIGQFTAIAVILFGGPWDHLPWWSWCALSIGVLLFLLAARALGGNFTVMPEPRVSNRLITSVPYRWLRHPMYTAVVVCALGLTLGAPTALRVITTVVVIVVLVLKIRHEEGLLRARYPDYDQVMQRAWRLVPFLW